MAEKRPGPFDHLTDPEERERRWRQGEEMARRMIAERVRFGLKVLAGFVLLVAVVVVIVLVARAAGVIAP